MSHSTDAKTSSSLEDDYDNDYNCNDDKQKGVMMRDRRRGKHIPFWKALNDDVVTATQNNMSAEEFLEKFQGRIPNFDYPTVQLKGPRANEPAAANEQETATNNERKSFSAASPQVVDMLITGNIWEIDFSSVNAVDLEAAISKIATMLGQAQKPKGLLQRLSSSCSPSHNDDVNHLETRRHFLKREQEFAKVTHEKDQEVAKVTHEKDQEVARAGLEKYVSSVYLNSAMVVSDLLYFSGLSTATSVTYAQNTLEADEEKREKKKLKRVPKRPDGDDAVALAEPDEPRQCLLENSKPLLEFSKSSLETEAFGYNLEYQAVLQVYQALFKKAFFIPREFENNCPLYTELMKASLSFLDEVADMIRQKKLTETSLNKILNKIDGRNTEEEIEEVQMLRELRSWSLASAGKAKEQPPIPDRWKNDWGKFSREDLRKKIDEVLKSMQRCLWLPGPTGQEVHGVQPLIASLLRAISEGLPENLETMQQRFSPLKGYVQSELKNPRTESRSGRVPDFFLSKRGRFLMYMWDDIGVLTGEWKPMQRMKSSIIELVSEQLNQGLSHGAKALLPALGLGPGCAGHSTFLLGTVMHVQVCRLVVENPGSSKVNLNLEISDYLPLVPSICFDRYLASDMRHPEETVKFRGDLYKDGLDHVHGLLALAKLMSSSQGTLFRLEHPVIQDASVLGFGTFAVVVAVPKKNQVLKLSRYGQRAEYKKELRILQHIRTVMSAEASDKSAEASDKSAEASDRIVSLVDHGQLTVPDKFISVAALLLSPQGQIPSSNLRDNVEHFSQIAKDLWNGLLFLHETCFLSHNDISTRNFVITGGRAVIVDLACADLLDTKKTAFVGTPDFVHKDIHPPRRSWWTTRSYDHAALAFTLCTLWNYGKTPWRPISKPCANPELLQMREDMTLEWLDECAVMNELPFSALLKTAVKECFTVANKRNRKVQHTKLPEIEEPDKILELDCFS